MNTILLFLALSTVNPSFADNIDFNLWDGSITPKMFYDNRCSIYRAATGQTMGDCGKYALLYSDGEPYYYHDQAVDDSVLAELIANKGLSYEFYWYFGNIDNDKLLDQNKNKMNPPASINILKCEKSNSGNIKITTATVHGLTDGEVIYIENSNSVDGVWRVEGISAINAEGKPYTNAMTFILKGSTKNNCIAGKGTFKKIIKGIVDKDTCSRSSGDCYRYNPSNGSISGDIEKAVHDCIGNLMTNIIKSSYDKMNKGSASYNKKIERMKSLTLPNQGWVTSLLYTTDYSLNGLKIYRDVIDQIHQKKYGNFVFVAKKENSKSLRCMINKDIAVEWIAPPAYYVDNGGFDKYIYDGKLDKKIEPDMTQTIKPTERGDGNVFGVVDFVSQPNNADESKKIIRSFTYNFYDYNNKIKKCSLKSLKAESYLVEAVNGFNELIIKFQDPSQPLLSTRCYAKASDAQGLHKQTSNANRSDIAATGDWCPATKPGDVCK